MKSKLRAALKLPPLLAHVAYGVALSAFVAVNRDRIVPRERLAQHWHGRLLKLLKVRVNVHGEPASGQRVIVANHVSWIDIPVMGMLEPTRFVSKAEVGNWPIAGWFADASGTFYIKRGAGGTRKLIENLKQHLIEHGGSFLFFPEGTTTEGQALLRFQPRLFAAAVDTGCPVQPVALRYAPTRDGRHVAPFVGDDDMLSHLLRVLQEPGIEVDVIYTPVLDPAVHGDRDSIAEAAQTAVQTRVAPQGVAAAPRARVAA